METGEVYSEKRVWHRYDGAAVTHWNSEHVGETYSVIVHNNKTSLAWKKQELDVEESNRYSFMFAVCIW